MTQTNPTPTVPHDSAADSESLMHLHKMSTTAGVGSQEYVAVNVTAVVAVLFGLASLLAIASPVLLVFPIVGVGLSLLALRQVKHSNGTQTGRGLAIMGLLLSGVITATIFSYQGYRAWIQRADEQAISSLIQKYGQALHDGKYAEAYDYFDSDFQNRVSKQLFVIRLTDIQKNPMVPPIDTITWNGLAQFNKTDEDTQTAETVMVLHYKGYPDEPRNEIRFKRDSGGPWLIQDIPEQFPPLKTPAQQAK